MYAMAADVAVEAGFALKRSEIRTHIVLSEFDIQVDRPGESSLRKMSEWTKKEIGQFG
jgi:hypothetical protein